MKKLLIVTVLLAAALSGFAEPLQWVCEWPKTKAQQFELYQGEIATFEPTFRINGGAPTNLPVVTVWYQTNGMDRTWWHTDGAVFHPTNDVGAASYRFFVDAAGDGGKLYRANGTLRMLPSPGFVPNTITPPVAALDFDSIDVSNAPYYTKDETDATIDDILVAFYEEFKAATNYTDSAFEFLTVEIDEAAQSATNYTDNVATTLRGEIAAAQPADYATVSNKAMTALQSYTETDPNVPGWAKASSKPTYTLNEVAPNSENWIGVQGNAGRTIKILAQGSGSSPAGGVQVTASTLNNNNTTTYAYSGVAVKRDGVNTDYLWDSSSSSGIVRRTELTSATNSTFIAATNYTDKAISEIPEPDYSTGNSALVATIAATAPPPGDYATVSNKAMTAVQTSELSSLETDPTVPSWAKAANKPSYTASEVGAATSNDLATISAMLNAENARFVSTNYNSATQIPAASVEAKIDGSWLTIWNELTRWTWLTDEYLPGNFYTKAQTDAAIADKADRAWGFYDPMTGDWAPEDCIWLSAPKVYVCAGGAYECVAETTGYWVLTANGMVANINGTTNGFFRISDSSNETQFEIVKSDKRTLFAHMTSMESVMGVHHYRTTYAITNAVAAPTANFARALGDGQQSWFDTDPSCPMNAIWEQTASNEWTLEWWPKSYENTIFVEAFYEQGGETFIRNVAPISVEGGILCTDGIHKCRPVYNNGSVTWEVVQ